MISGYNYSRDLGRGGFSDVYLYTQQMPRRQVAIKVLRVDTLDAKERQAFTDEANTMALLADHPNIVPVLAADLTSDGRPYLVMTYYPNDDLGKKAALQPLGLADALRTGIQLACAVESAHRMQILHRDIKPANVLLSRTGAPGLTDFGIAGAVADHDDDDEVGVSIPWSAPEVLSGQSGGSVASDIYSLGATIWHLLVGRSPFRVPSGDNSQSAMINRILRTPPPGTGVTGVPPTLDRLLAQCLAKEPSVRPRSALQLARELQQVEANQSLSRTDLVILDAEVSEMTSSKPPAPVDAPRPPALGSGDPTIGKTPISLPPDRGPGPREQPTVGKPQSIPPSSRDLAPVTQHKPTPRVGDGPDVIKEQASSTSWRWVAVAAVVIAAGAVGVHLLTDGDPSQDGGGSSTGRTTAPPPGDLVDAAPGAPILKCSVHGATAKITWKPVEGAESYTWQLQSGSAASATQVNASPLTLPMPTQGGLRVQVTAINGSGVPGEPSGPSDCQP